VSANVINFDYDDDIIHGESDISIDSKLVAADDKKELVERKGCAILGRIFACILFLGINGFVILAVGFFYYTEKFYNSENNYTWVAVFFGAQILGFFVIDVLIVLVAATFLRCCCCRSNKVCLARIMRDSLYINEDYQYVTEYSQHNAAEPPQTPVDNN
jgi:hypothetical protein